MSARPVLAFLAVVIMLAATHAAGAAAKAATDRLQRVVVHADSLVGNLAGDSPDRFVSIYLPPSYVKQAQRRYPVLYLLHGFTDTDARWFGLEGKHFVHAPTAVDAAFANGVAEMIVVMPNAFNRYHGSMYSSSVVIGNWETFITRELVRFVDSHYRTLARPESRGLAGHSMGGYGTLRLGMKAPGVFTALYAMSPCCVAPEAQLAPEIFARAAKVRTSEEIAAADFLTKAMLASAAAWSPNPKDPPMYFDLPVVDGNVVAETTAEWIGNMPLAVVHQYIPALKTYQGLAIDAGDKDASIASHVKSLHAVLDDYAIPHSYEIYDGDHLNRIEDRLTKKVLPFFGRQLKSQRN